MTTSSSITIQREIDSVGGERIVAGEMTTLWQLGDGRLVIETNGDPIWEDHEGFYGMACDTAAEGGVGLHYASEAWKKISDPFSWAGFWPVIDRDGRLTGEVTEGDEDYCNVDDDAMIHRDEAAAGGWTIDDDGYATPPCVAT